MNLHAQVSIAYPWVHCVTYKTTVVMAPTNRINHARTVSSDFIYFLFFLLELKHLLLSCLYNNKKYNKRCNFEDNDCGFVDINQQLAKRFWKRARPDSMNLDVKRPLLDHSKQSSRVNYFLRLFFDYFL
jgi:hypothetical protein